MTAFVFDREPPKEVADYLRQKGDRPAFRWSEVWGEEHAHAFTAAKAVQADVLKAIRTSLQRAIDEGRPYEAWARDLKPELERLGWWGRRDMVNPATGELVQDAELGSPRRLRILYDANLRSARASGQWERAQRTKSVLPFFVYGLGPSVEHRPEHAAKAGHVAAVDDPFWRAWFPPNGWGCKCWVRQITRAEATRLGGPSRPLDVPNRTFRRVRDDGSIETAAVPVGIDPGWQTNAGLNRAATLMSNFRHRLEGEGEPEARALLDGFWAGSTPEALTGLKRPVEAPAAVLPERVRAELGVTEKVVSVKTSRLRRKLETPRLRPVGAGDFARVQQLLDRGALVEVRGASRAYLLEMDDGWWLGAVFARPDGGVELASLYPITPGEAAEKLRKVAGGGA